MTTLHLALDNVTSLPDGGPTTFEVRGRRSVDIGRDHYLDWTLPDPERIVSGRHCEIRFADDGYWLTDVSTNGTFLNGGAHRISEPHRLRTGDVIGIGNYLVRVHVHLEDGAAPSGAAADADAHAVPPDSASLWDAPVKAAPHEPVEARKPSRTPVHADALDVWVDVAPAQTHDYGGPSEASRPWATDDEARGVGAEAAAVVEAAPQDDAVAAADASNRRPHGPPAAEIEPVPIIAADASAATAAPLERSLGDPVDLPPDDRSIAAPRGPAATIADSPAPQTVADAMPRDPGRDAPFSVVPGLLSAERSLGADEVPSHAAAPVANRAARPTPEEGEAYARFLRQLGSSLGLPDQLLAEKDPEELADQIGRFLRHSVEGLHALLKARSVSRGIMRRSGGTTVEAVDNNPLKFLPTAEDVLRVLLGPPTRSYLDLDRAMDETFRDIGRHQIASYAAMQVAVKRIFDDLAPAAIEAAQPEESTLGNLLKGSKGRLWDTYKERYAARSEPHDNGIVDLFILYFGDAYERAASRAPDERRD